MAFRRRIYAFLMVVIYTVATLLSAISLMACDHHHAHIHHVTHCSECCTCNGVTVAQDCCDHEHPVFGENHTDYIDSSYRSDSRMSALTLMSMFAPMVLTTISGEQPIHSYAHFEYGSLDDVGRPSAALASCRLLRAPPVMA
jgi:hypothetical protein